jgi:hypothetical protein
MKLIRKKASTSNILHIFFADSASTTGAGKTGILYSGVTAYYVKPGDATATAITMADITTLGTYVSGGLKEFDAINLPGVYEFDPPDACFTTADNVLIMIQGTGIAPLPIEIQLDDNTSKDVYDRIGVAGAGLTAIDLPDQTMNITGSLSGSVGSVTGAVGSVTGDVGGNVVGSVASVTAGVTVTTNNDKTGYALTQVFPTNFADLAITVTTGLVDVNGKTGFSLAADQSAVTVGTVNALGAQAKLDVNAEVDSALDTAIPAVPTADSINQRIAAIDDLTQAGGGGDLAAILTDTGTTLETHLTDIKGTGFVKDTDSLPQCLTATGFNTTVPDPAGTAASLHATTDAHLTDIKGTGFVKDTNSLPQCLTATGFATPTNITAGTITTVTNLTNAPTNGDLTDVMKASINTEVDNALDTAIPATPTADSINDYIQRNKMVAVNKMTITEASGDTTIYKDDDISVYATVLAAFTSDSTTTTRKRLE